MAMVDSAKSKTQLSRRYRQPRIGRQMPQQNIPLQPFLQRLSFTIVCGGRLNFVFVLTSTALFSNDCQFSPSFFDFSTAIEKADSRTPRMRGTVRPVRPHAMQPAASQAMDTSIQYKRPARPLENPSRNNQPIVELTWAAWTFLSRRRRSPKFGFHPGQHMRKDPGYCWSIAVTTSC
ncbi:hypothetical protein BKA80DRAFT_112611 [Phyllosticta citrichinensis]